MISIWLKSIRQIEFYSDTAALCKKIHSRSLQGRKMIVVQILVWILDFRRMISEKDFEKERKDDSCSNLGLDFRLSANELLHTAIAEDQM